MKDDSAGNRHSPIAADNLVDKAPGDAVTLVGLARAHRLVPAGEDTTRRASSITSVEWYEEYDAHNVLVSRYRIWRQRGTVPPYRRELGWERFAVDGTLLDRELRLTRLPHGQHVH